MSRIEWGTEFDRLDKPHPSRKRIEIQHTHVGGIDPLTNKKVIGYAVVKIGGRLEHRYYLKGWGLDTNEQGTEVIGLKGEETYLVRHEAIPREPDTGGTIFQPVLVKPSPESASISIKAA